MQAGQEEIRIGLIGPTSAGKTSLFNTFNEALDRGRHGFPRGTSPHIRRTAEPTPVEGLAPEDIIDRVILGESGSQFDELADLLGDKIAATPLDRVVSRHYAVNYNDLEDGRERAFHLTVTDAAGEHSFGKELNQTVAEYRRQLHRELANCHGFVVVVPFSSAGEVSFLRPLESWLEALDKIAIAQEKAGSTLPRQRRLVIALTRYDVLLTDFGSDAFNLAADPGVATDLINRLVRTANGDSYKNRIAKFDRSGGGRFDIVFVPTSSFGFVPGFGCANLDPDVSDDDVLAQITTGGSPGPFKAALPGYPGQHLFPFLTGDPFIYAATGMKNPFVVPIDFAVRQVRFADRPTDREGEHTRAPGGATPDWETPSGYRPEAGDFGRFGGAFDTVFNGFSNFGATENDSWRRRLARFLRRIDIEL